MPRGGKRTAGPGKRIGGEPKPVEQKAVINGKVRVRINPATEMIIPVDAETRALAQRLMLHFPDVPNVESLFPYAVRRLSEMTDD